MTNYDNLVKRLRDEQRDEEVNLVETLKTTLSKIANLDPSQEPWARTIASRALEKLK